MNDKIQELKKLIETLEADSPLRHQLEDALKAEEARRADEEQAEEARAEKQEQTQAPEESDGKKRIFDAIDEVIDKLDDLMQDDEFVSGLAGFVLGAVVAGLGVAAMNGVKPNA